MVRQTFEKESTIRAPATKVFNWHKSDEALKKLIPPSDPVEVKSRTGSIQNGDIVRLRITILGPIGIDWVARHQNYEEGKQFEDVQEQGPFHHWVHTHIVDDLGDDRCVLKDHVEYELPFGWVSYLLIGWFVRRKLQSMFDYRHEVTKSELEETGPTE